MLNIFYKSRFACYYNNSKSPAWLSSKNKKYKSVVRRNNGEISSTEQNKRNPQWVLMAKISDRNACAVGKIGLRF